MSLTVEQLIKKSSKIKSVQEAKDIIGGGGTPFGFSDVTKMPCLTYSLPATMCKTGTILRSVKGSSCSGCYACPTDISNHVGGFYGSDRVQQPMNHKLLQVLFNPRWTEAMIYLFDRYQFPFFRWHDSGDLQNDEHFENICKIADAVPNTKFWLPTQEWGNNSIVERYWDKKGRVSLKELHPNLIVRLSARMIDGSAPVWYANMLGVTTSRISTKTTDVNCPASKQGNNCGTCRKCWNNDITSITYHFHDGHDHFMKSEFMQNVKNYMLELLDLGIGKVEIYDRTVDKFNIQRIQVRIIARKIRLDIEKRLEVLSS